MRVDRQEGIGMNIVRITIAVLYFATLALMLVGGIPTSAFMLGAFGLSFIYHKLWTVFDVTEWGESRGGGDHIL